jgi:hypothetical protein
MKRLTLLALTVAAAMLGVAVAAPAQATEPGATVPAICDKAWYVNPDETALLPKQTEDGLLFDGPSLIHHAASGSLATAPGDGSFTVTGDVTGSKPLFKLETSSPYSTVNKTTSGYWSSKIATGPGSQAAPADTLAALAALAPYTEATTLHSFGVGYANDAGNKALVTSVTFGGKSYDLSCTPKPEKTPSASPTATATHAAPTTHKPAPHPSGASAAAVAGLGGLPLTGPGVGVFAGVGALVLLVGAGLVWAARRRRTRFTA